MPVSSSMDEMKMSGAHSIRSAAKPMRSEGSSAEPVRRFVQSVSVIHSRRQDASSSLRSSRVRPVSSSMSETIRSRLQAKNAVVTSPVTSVSSIDRASMVATTSSPATHSARQASVSASNSNASSSPIPATIVERNTAWAVSGARHEKIKITHASGVSASDMTGRASTDSKVSPSNVSRTHSCSALVRASNTSPHSVWVSTRRSKSEVAPVVSGRTVVVLLGAVVVLPEVVVVGVVAVVLGVVVVLLSAVEVDSGVESPPQPARAMMTARAPNIGIQWTRRGVTDDFERPLGILVS